ncbi:unnamed protein product, partial [marine sediment metagenome]
MKSPEEKQSISPEGIFFNAFDYFQARELDIGSLTRIALAAGCPNEETAHRVLASMTEKGLL